MRTVQEQNMSNNSIRPPAEAKKAVLIEVKDFKLHFANIPAGLILAYEKTGV